MASEEVETLLSNPELAQKALTDPESVGPQELEAVSKLLGNPAVLQLIGDPAIRGLISDPAALQLMMDPLTAELIATGGQPELEGISVYFRRVRTAKRTEGDILYLDQDFIASMTESGEPLPRFSSTSLIAVDRNSRYYVEGGSEALRGGFAFPADMTKDQTYQIWVHEVFQPLTSRFVATGEVEGLDVYTFQIRETGLTVPDETKRALGMPESLKLIADVVINTHSDPKSGITVQLDSKIAYKLNAPVLGNPTLFESEFIDTEGSVHMSVGDAQTAKRKLFWLGTFLPWAAMGLGILMTGVSSLFFVQSKEQIPN